jgi:hypothetical protein
MLGEDARTGGGDRRSKGDVARAVTVAVLAVLLGAAPTPTLDRAFAQATAQGPQVRVAPRVLVEVDVETPLMINVGPAESMPPNSYVQLRGLPETATLNEGHSVSPGTWSVPMRALSNLSILAPQASTGTTEFTVRVVSLEGSVLAEVRSSIIVAAGYVIGQRTASAEPPRIVQPPTPVAPPAPPAAAVPQRQQLLAAPSPAAPPAAAPVVTPKDNLPTDERARLERLVGLGNRQLSNGNIAAAREFYRRAADGGLAEGALLLATTYDPAELSVIKVQGLSPDLAEARRWYERAKALGSPGADARLGRLGSR